MYIEKRKIDKNIKYYLIYSYRDGKKVLKIRRYIGLNLSKDELNKKAKILEKDILNVLESLKTEIFNFELTKNQINSLNNYNKNLSIVHFKKNEWQNFTEKFVYNTNAIEGSTVKQDEVSKILKIKKASIPDEIETLNVAKAINYIKNTKEPLSIELILNLHKLCFLNTKDFAGKIRNVEVVVTNSKGDIIHQGLPYKNVKKELLNLVFWYAKNKKKFKPLVLAAIIHNQFEYIHPFEDGNGRVGRLLLNYVLLKNKYPPINIFLEDRLEYYSSLNDYSKIKDLKPTLKFLVKQYEKTLGAHKK